MPIKQCACSICGQTVNKAQTYFIGDGKRACKSHEGVIEKRDALEARKLESSRRVKERIESWKIRDKRLGENFAKPHCWLCGLAGLRQDEFFTRILIEMEKAQKIYGIVNPLDMSHPANKGLAKEPCIFIVAKEKAAHVVRSMRPDLRMLPDMTGVFAICGACAQKNNIEVLPKPDFDDLVKMGVVYDLFMKPAIQQIANREMIRDS